MAPPSISLRRTKDYDLIKQLDRECLPLDDAMQESTFPDSVWWVAVAKAPGGSQEAAYAGLYLGIVGEAWLVRAGVLKAYRGGKLQQRLIRVRLREARRLGIRKVFTYTNIANIPSQRNLLACGFLPYKSDDDALYFVRELGTALASRPRLA